MYIDKCPYCGSDKLIKRGFDPYNKQKYKCNNCGKYPTEGAKRHRNKEDIKPIIPKTKKDKEKEIYENVKKISEEVLSKLEKRERLEPQYKKGELKPEKWLLSFSDMQYGLVVNPVEIGGLGFYSPKIARERLNYLIKTLIDILRYFPNKPEELYIACLGDNIENAYMQDNQQSRIEFGICEQIIEFEEMFLDMIIALSKYFPIIKIFAVVGGNHGRMGKKKNSASPTDNFEYLIYHYLEKRLEDMKDIYFNYTKAKHMIVDINDWNFWLEHGDTVRSWAGIPFYGLKREMANINAMLRKFHKQADFLLAGHFHTKANFEDIYMNGSFPGGDAYSVGDLRRMDFPYQKLLGVNKKHGIVWDRNICLIDDPRKLKIKVYK